MDDVQKYREAYEAESVSTIVRSIDPIRENRALDADTEQFYRAAKALHIAETEGTQAALKWKLAQA